MTQTARLFLAFSIFLQLLIVRVLSYCPEFVETYYSQSFYPVLSKIFRFIFGWIPYSVGDVLIIFAAVYGLYWIVSHFGLLVKHPKTLIIKILTAMSVIYFMFHLLWGLNYYRLPLNKRLNLKLNYTTETLINTTQKLIATSNTLHLSIVRDSSKVVEIPYDFKTLSQKIAEGYNLTSKSYSFLKYTPSSQKQSLFSLPQAYMGFSGYLNPLTNEAQVNYYTPTNSMPQTLAHEQAHQLGYAAENEANFLAFLTMHNHSDKLIRYAAHTFALRYCLNDLYKRSPEDFKRLRETINLGVLEDYKGRREHWSQFQNPLEPYFKFGYNSYLKANNQKEGIESYNRVVAYLVNFLNT